MKHLNKEKLLLIISILPAILMFCITRGIRVKIFGVLIFIAYTVYVVLLKNLKINKEYFKDKKIIILSLIIEASIFIDFFFVCQHKAHKELYNIPFLSHNVVSALLGIFCCVISYFAIYFLSNKLIPVISSYLAILKKYKFHYIVLTSVLIISFISIFRANFNYIDDLGRTVLGYGMVGDFSRYIADFCSKFLHMNSYLADVSPLTQIIALCIMGLTGITLLSVFSFGKKTSLWSVCSLIPMTINPYFLQCLSYKYDAPYMALSVFVSVAPIIFYKKSSIKYGFTVFCGTLIMCTTYQSSSGIFPMIVAFMCLMLWNRKEPVKEIGRFLAVSGVAYVVGMLTFRLLLMTPIDSTNSYINNEIYISQIVPNIFKYLKLVISDYNSIWKLFVCVLLICFIFLQVITTKQNKYLSLLVNVIMIFITMVISFGVYIVFQNLRTNPRYMYGIGVFFSIIAIQLFVAERCFLGKVAAFLLSWSFVVFAFVYGNALSSQKEYADFRTEQVVAGLSQSRILHRDKKFNIRVEGTIGFSKSVENMIDDFPVLKRMIPITLRDSQWRWGDFKLINCYDLNLQRSKYKHFDKHNLTVIKNNYYYCIKSDKKSLILIKLKTVGK